MTCQHPECDRSDEREYTDHAGNSLELCREHYFHAVFPHPLSVNTVADGEEFQSGGLMDLFQ